MNKEETLLSLKSLMSIKKMECDMHGVDFDVEAALTAAGPVVESLIYTLTSGGKLETSGGDGAVAMSDEVLGYIAEADALVRPDGSLEPGYSGAAEEALVNIVTASRRAAEARETDDSDDKAKDWSAELDNVDDFFNSLGGK